MSSWRCLFEDQSGLTDVFLPGFAEGAISVRRVIDGQEGSPAAGDLLAEDIIRVTNPLEAFWRELSFLLDPVRNFGAPDDDDGGVVLGQDLFEGHVVPFGEVVLVDGRGGGVELQEIVEDDVVEEFGFAVDKADVLHQFGEVDIGGDVSFRGAVQELPDIVTGGVGKGNVAGGTFVVEGAAVLEGAAGADVEEGAALTVLLSVLVAEHAFPENENALIAQALLVMLARVFLEEDVRCGGVELRVEQVFGEEPDPFDGTGDVGLAANRVPVLVVLPDDMVGHREVGSRLFDGLDQGMGERSASSGFPDGFSETIGPASLDPEDISVFRQVKFADCLIGFRTKLLASGTFRWNGPLIDRGDFHFPRLGHLEVHVLAGRQLAVVILDDILLRLDLFHKELADGGLTIQRQEDDLLVVQGKIRKNPVITGNNNRVNHEAKIAIPTRNCKRNYVRKSLKISRLFLKSPNPECWDVLAGLNA